jgi:CDP-diacylglycerol--glycerol-3-phosphate 3-phosphatidyltransferase
MEGLIVEQAAKKEPVTFSDLMRARFKGIVEPLARFLIQLGLKPNTVTLFGLLGTAVGAFFIAVGQVSLGGIIIMFMAPVDALDGAMARLRGEPSSFGAFVDSVTDRYAELLIFGGLLFYYQQQQDWIGASLAYLAAAGSILVSYIRARAQSVGFETKIGIFSRFERLLVLIPCLVFDVPWIALSVIALLANVTAVQRILHVRSQAHARMGVSGKK